MLECKAMENHVLDWIIVVVDEERTEVSSFVSIIDNSVTAICVRFQCPAQFDTTNRKCRRCQKSYGHTSRSETPVFQLFCPCCLRSLAAFEYSATMSPSSCGSCLSVTEEASDTTAS